VHTLFPAFLLPVTDGLGGGFDPLLLWEKAQLGVPATVMSFATPGIADAYAKESNTYIERCKI
jgi:hypothetical protein